MQFCCILQTFNFQKFSEVYEVLMFEFLPKRFPQKRIFKQVAEKKDNNMDSKKTKVSSVLVERQMVDVLSHWLSLSSL